MYICICNSVSHQEIEDAVERGHVSSMSCLRRSLGVGSGCGICLGDARQCLFDAMSRSPLKEITRKYETLEGVSAENLPQPGNSS